MKKILLLLLFTGQCFGAQAPLKGIPYERFKGCIAGYCIASSLACCGQATDLLLKSNAVTPSQLAPLFCCCGAVCCCCGWSILLDQALEQNNTPEQKPRLAQAPVPPISKASDTEKKYN